MSYTAAQIVALEQAIASGATTVSYSDKRVEYRSLAEMRQILADMRNNVGGFIRIKQIRMTTAGDKAL